MELTIYKCENCGNVLVPAIDAYVVPVCCGDMMKVLKAGDSDGAVEKHVPVIARDADGKHVDINVGSVPHPMTNEHYIQFVVMMRGDRFGVIGLNPGDEPKVKCTFDDNSGPVKAYAYCNLHGLWESEA
jgi:superoxide reductase